MRISVISILVIIIAVGGWVALNRDNSSSQDSNVTTSNNTNSEQSQESVQGEKISYTSNGFSPSSLTISAGDTVIFTNNNTRPMWVASNPHPTHTDLSGFDQRKSVSNDGTYEFTFVTPGEYFYHNHLSIGHVGTIIVK